MDALERGAVMGGYRFVGSDPSDPQSWEAESLTRGSVMDGHVYLGGDPAQKTNWAPKAGALRTAGDMGIKVAQGVVGLGESAVGLADLATGGLAGKGMAAVGYDPKAAKEILGQGLSASQRIADQNVAGADGFVGMLAAAVQNPRSIVGAVAESAPSILGTGAVSSLVAKRIFQRAALAAGGLETAAGQAAGRAAVEAAGGRLMWAGSGAEGALTAGQIAEQARQENPDDPAAMYFGIPAGIATALIGRGAGKLMGDAETAIFTGAKSAGVSGSLPARIAKSAFSEGVLEEAPQSAQEQAFTNLATNKPVGQGVGQAAAMGLVTGGVMGGGMAAVQGEVASQRLAEAKTVPDMISAATALAGVPLEFPKGDEAAQLMPKPQTPALETAPGVKPAPAPGSIEYEPQAVIDTSGLQLQPAEPFTPAPQPQALAPKVDAAIQGADGLELEDQARIRQAAERRQEIAAAPVDRAPRSASSEPIVIDPVGAFLNEVRRTNTPQARAFLQEFDAGRITRQDIVRQMQSAPADEVQQRLASAAAQAPAPAATSDIQVARTYRSRSGAFVEARKSGGTVEPVQGGFTVKVAKNVQPDVAVPPSVADAPADGERNLVIGGNRTLGRLADAGRAGQVRAGVPEAPAGGDAGQIGGPAGGRDQALKGPDATTAEAQAVEAPAPAGGDAAAETSVPAAGGAGDVQAAGLSPVDAAANEAATSPTNDRPEPTQAQKEAGNYAKGHVRVGGLDITVENPQGSTRSGVDTDGKAWTSTLAHHYGYVKRTKGADGEHVDVFVKPGTAEDHAGSVYVVDQIDPRTNAFDEHKAMIGFDSEQEAREAYAANYAKDWKGLKSVTPMSTDEFKAWVRDEAVSTKPAAPAKIEDTGEKIGGARKDTTAPAAEAPPAPNRVIARAGRTPGSAVPIELRANKDGTVTPFMEGSELLDFDSGEPIVLPSSVTDQAAKEAIRKAGAVSRSTNFFKPEAMQRDTAAKADRAGPLDLLQGSSGKGIPVRLAERYAKAYEDAGLQRVNVARNIDELPESLRKKLSGFGDDVRGAYFPKEDEIWVFSDKVSTPDELAFVVMHEAFHRGLGDLIGDNAKRLLRQMYQTNKVLRDRVGTVMNELKIDRDTAIEEVLADMAGEGDARKLRGWERLAKMITDWLNKIGDAVGISRTFSNKDIETFVTAMARAGITTDPVATGKADGFDADAVKARPEAEVKASRAATLPLPANEPTTESAVNAKAGWRLDASTRLDDIIYEIQDKLIDTKQAMQAIRDAGRQIKDEFDPYLQEELYHGRAAKQTADFLDQEVRPLLAEMGKIGVSMQTLEKFLHARHAEERNEQVAKVNPEMADGGSGMKTADARKYLQELSAPARARLDKLAAKVDAITTATRDYLVETGLESSESVKAWEGTYKHYVPLQRADVDAGGSLRGTGTGFSVKGSASKRAMGSDREVDNILANVMMQRERAITRAEKNRVATAVYGLAIQAPNKGFWMPIDPDANQRTPAEMKALEAELVSMGMNPADAEAVFKEPKQRYIDPKTGLVRERINPAIRSSDNVLALRVGGKDRFVFFSDKDPRAVRMVTALKNLDAPQMGEMMGLAAKITRYFSAINTSYNPIFGVVNLIRDFQSALFNQSTTAIAGQEKEVARHVPAALKGIMLALRARRTGGSTDSIWAQTFDEFEKAGGRTGYRDMYATAKDRAEALEKEIKRASSTEGKGIAAFRSGFEMLSDYNDTMENALRLSAYKVARDRGLAPEQAASLAKNLTVNFNRRGHLTSQVGALYAFFNASAQGTARLVETMKGPRGKKILIGGMLLGAMQALMIAGADFDDGQPPDFVRERNFIIPIGDGKYLAVPMPLGLHVIPSMTRIPVEWALSGFKNTGKHISSLMGLVLDTFNPIGGAGMSLQTLTPTILDPFTALAENKDFSGRPIYKEDFGNRETPGFTRKKDTASFWSQGLSYAINWLTGGTDFKPGAFSPTPDAIDYLIGQVFGGVGRETSKIFQTAEAAKTGEELPAYKIPLFGRLYGDSKETAAVAGTYYDHMRQMHLHAQEIKGRRAQGEPTADYIEENPEVRLAPLAVATEKRVTNLRKLRKAMVEKDTYSAEQLAVVDRRIAEEMVRFNERMKAAKD